MRGIPTYSTRYAEAMRALLYHGSIHCEDTRVEDYILLSLSEGYKCDFVYLNEANRYIFASPLHQQMWSWHLLLQVNHNLPHDNFLSFVKATMSQFRSCQLGESGLEGSDSHGPSETQYKDEYYRCIYDLTCGNVKISPEYAAAYGSRPGRIDFYIPMKMWGIQLTHEGSKLEEYDSRLTDDAAYGQWLFNSNMMDYILLDFCINMPTRAHPGKKMTIILIG